MRCSTLSTERSPAIARTASLISRTAPARPSFIESHDTRGLAPAADQHEARAADQRDPSADPRPGRAAALVVGGGRGRQDHLVPLAGSGLSPRSLLAGYGAMPCVSLR